MNDKDFSLFDRLSGAVFIAMLAVIAMTFRDYGVAWDEPFHEHYGYLIERYIATLGADSRVLEFRNLGLYGGLFDFPTALIVNLLPFEPYQSRHLIISLTGLTGIGGAWAMARWLGGAQAGFWAAVLLIATPSYFGHMFINPKDIPFATAYMWAIYFTARAATLLPGLHLRILLSLGACVGAAMGVRIGGIVLVGYLGLLIGLHLIWVKGRAAYPIGTAATLRVLLQAMGIVIWPCMILTFIFWPSAWPWLFDQALVAVMISAKYAGAVDVLYKGHTVSSVALPLGYVPWHLAIKLPLVLLGLSLVAVPFAVRHFIQGWNSGDRKTVFGLAVLVLGFGFPVAFAMVRGSAHYDAVRHFLFVMPPLCVFAALYWTRALEVLARRRETAALATNIILALLIGATALSTARLHPYEYTDYNAIVGGLKGAQGRYEIDYWAVSYREAAQRLRALTSVTGPGDVSVYVCGPFDSIARFLPRRFTITDTVQEADFFISLTRWGCDAKIEAPVVFDVQREGVRMSVVKDLRAGFTQTGELPKQIRIVEDYPRYGEEN